MTLASMLGIMGCANASGAPSGGTDGGPQLQDAGAGEGDGGTVDSSAGDAGELGIRDAATREMCGEPEQTIYRLDDIEGCVVARGSVHISDQHFGFADLEALRSLRVVHGSLTFFRNPNLVTTSALSNLEHVGGRFGFGVHDGLERLEGFERLRTIGGEFYLYHNQALEHISGFSSLESVGSLHFANNTALPRDMAEAFAARIGVVGDILIE